MASSGSVGSGTMVPLLKRPRSDGWGAWLCCARRNRPLSMNEEELVAELRKVAKVSALKGRARAEFGVSQEALDLADDEEDVRATVIELIIGSLRNNLAADPLFAAVRERTDQRLATATATVSEPHPNACAVQVTGSQVFPWLNQIYHVVPTPIVEEVLRDDWIRVPAMCILGRGKAGPWLYLAEKPSPRGQGSLPYLWYDQYNMQWKMATLGIRGGSHYISSLAGSGAFPRDLGEWIAVPANFGAEVDPLCPAHMRVQPPRRLYVVAVFGPSRCPVCKAAGQKGAPLLRTPEPQFPDVLEEVSLTVEDAMKFYREGFLVKRAAEIGMCQNEISRALRATNIIMRDSAGDRVNIRDFAVDVKNRAWHDCIAWLRTCPQLWTLLARMFGAQVAVPLRCQVALALPDGDFGEQFLQRADGRPGTEYHIDGRGKLPNGFGLLVGCALSDPPEKCTSWGAFTVFPTSHMNTELHRLYVERWKTGEPKPDLGDGKQLLLNRGDVVIAHPLLAHRRGLNWSAVGRHMIFLRLKPEGVTEQWEAQMLENPFSVLRGVAQVAGAFQRSDAAAGARLPLPAP